MALEYLNMTGRRVLLFITIFLFISFKSFSAVFTVTSNADSGPGTLREALTLAAANGSTTKDYIYFNLPNLTVADRTISIKTDLPEITSDIVIDGSTQPGPPLSINGAKVVINGFNEQARIRFCFIVGTVNTFELYGVVAKNFFVTGGTQGGYGGVFVSLQGKIGHVIIGAPGKGNDIYNVGWAVEGMGEDNSLNLPTCRVQTFEMKNNLIGIGEDGVKIGAYKQSIIGLPFTFNVIIGGDNKNEGNTIFDLVSLVPAAAHQDLEQDFNFKIKNNIFSANSQQQRTDDPYIDIDRNDQAFVMGVEPLLHYSKKSTGEVSDNVFGYTLFVSGLTNLDLNIQHNFFGTSTDQKNKIPVGGEAITFYYTEGHILVGGPDNSKGNVFTNCVQDQRAIDYEEAVVNTAVSGPDFNYLNHVELSHNSFYCNNNPAYTIQTVLEKKPISVTVDQLSATNVNGTTKPNARVELFYTDKECDQCQPKTYVATTYADAAGKWTYNGSLLPGYGVMAGATLNNISSEFTDTRILFSNTVVITHQECDMGGSIKNALVVTNAKKLEWLNENGDVVGTKIDLENVPAGKYRLRAEQFGCVKYSPYFLVEDHTPKFFDFEKKVIQPSCGNGGAITNLYTSFADKAEWLNDKNEVISNQQDQYNLAEGSYTLRITGPRGCVKTYGPIVLKNTTGPTIDQLHPDKQSTSCGQSKGSIKNIIVTGTGNIKYSWLNAQHQEVANTNDLTGQPAGMYTLKVTDDSQCGPVYSSEIEIPETNGITLNENSVTRIPATCSQNNGSIKGITAPGATHYKWINTANNNEAGSSPDLADAAAGSYQLIASNDFGCSKPSQIYTIDAIPVTVYPNYAANITNSCSGQNSGSITLTTDPLVKTMRWIDGNGQPAGTDANPHGLKPGTYKVYFTDARGCETLYPHDFTVNEIDPLQIVANSETRTDDQCGLNTGSIKNIQVKGGTQPYTYLWLNVAGEHLFTSRDLTGVGAGDYTLQVQDAGGCGVMASHIYTVLNENSSIDAPVINPLQLCAPGEALLSVSSPSAGNTYRLYDSQTSTQYQDEQTNGIFKIKANPNSTYYISKVSGQCESERTQAQITISLSAIDIPNAFTPNGDGKNDYWKINNAQNYPQAIVQIFTRYGQKVFESKGYSVPFDGTYNGTILPSGVYYYILNLGKSCNLLSGSLSIIR